MCCPQLSRGGISLTAEEAADLGHDLHLVAAAGGLSHLRGDQVAEQAASKGELPRLLLRFHVCTTRCQEHQTKASHQEYVTEALKVLLKSDALQGRHSQSRWPPQLVTAIAGELASFKFQRASDQHHQITWPTFPGVAVKTRLLPRQQRFLCLFQQWKRIFGPPLSNGNVQVLRTRKLVSGQMESVQQQ